MDEKKSRIVQLAAAISKNVTIVDSYFTTNGLPSPSYDINGPSDVRIPPYEQEVLSAYTTALSATMELQNLLKGPRQMLTGFGSTVADGASLHAVHRFNMDKTFLVG
ncbi:MAG: hypothetical protein M1820_008130 [Bogoriella megaspora]|nr:MAG: hypothetical protein M1820_008130 [Bogoriella megaspora]